MLAAVDCSERQVKPAFPKLLWVDTRVVRFDCPSRVAQAFGSVEVAA